MRAFRGFLYIILGGAYFITVFGIVGKSDAVEFLSDYGVSETVLMNFSAFVIFVTLLGIFIFLEKFIHLVTQKYIGDIKSKIVPKILDIAFYFLSLIKIVIAFSIAFGYAQVPVSVNNFVLSALEVAIFLLLLLAITKSINLFFELKSVGRGSAKVVNKTLLPFLQKAFVVFVWIVGLLMMLSNIGFDVTAVIAGAGVGGIAIALAAQKSVSNIFGAITILLNKPFQLGDFVTIEGHTGTVKDIGLTYITLSDKSGHDVMIPNENIISSSIENQSRRSFRRADFGIGLIYDTTLEQMKQGVEIIESILQEKVDEKTLQSFRVNFDTFGDFSLNINVTYYTNTNDYNAFVKEKEGINLNIKKQFQDAGLEMAFPTTEMIIKKGDL